MYRLKKLKIFLVLSLLVNVLLIGAGSYALSKKSGKELVKQVVKPQDFSAYYLQKTQLYDSLDYGKVDKIFVGDSITDHGELQTYFPGEVVLNRGIVDDKSKGVLKRIDEVVKRKPKEVYILIGINDIGENVDVDVYEKNMEKIIQSFDKASTKVIIQSILPINNQDFQNKISNETVDQFNEVLQKLVKKHGLEYVDLNPHFKDTDGQLKEELTVDGVHLSGKGYDLWMENL
ncbi:GDSL-type esterase/lipase family protein [Paenisporosarcina sp. NPDC076898]|uniref:GDSL-type esterase/lipase family protein n=1 Tax=unclassified Paenisporosarcina TaxID=2642018 RepID=UPI003CFE8593